VGKTADMVEMRVGYKNSLYCLQIDIELIHIRKKDESIRAGIEKDFLVRFGFDEAREPPIRFEIAAIRRIVV
jgi:hypothetical protein